MSDAGDAPDAAVPAPNPDAQTTVNDFLDYTDFFPSDLVRSLTLIGDLDSTYHDHVQHVHDLTALYGKLPALPEHGRPDPAALRRNIARHMHTALSQREYAFAEASRLYEVALRHCKRSTIIKKKLQAQPEPPSRDPTPLPVSPTAHRPAYRNYERPPHQRLLFDSTRKPASTSRPRDRHRKNNASVPRRRRRVGSDSDESDVGSTIDVISPRKHKQRSDRHPKSGRSRPPGVLGTNVHSSIAGISTSNALAQLAPPPADARPGSKWAPWDKLTEWEMATLRKQMKKNAVWKPSETMVTRELEKKHRTLADYAREKRRCEETGEEFLDEQPETLQQLMTASGLGKLAPHGSPQPKQSRESTEDHFPEESGTFSIRPKPLETKDGRRLDRLSQRKQAMRDAQELVDATEKIKEAANGLKELTFGSHAVSTPTSHGKKSTRSLHKRKRDSSQPAADEADTGRELSVSSVESAVLEPEPKRARLQLNVPERSTETPPQDLLASPLSSEEESNTEEELLVAEFPVRKPSQTTNGVTVQIPLAPAGPATPRASKIATTEASYPSTLTITTPTPESSPDILAPTQAPIAQSTATAASSRPRRESFAPKVSSPPEPLSQPIKTSKSSTPVPESLPDAVPLRPRSARGHMPTPKAQSEEPKPNESGRALRETRRHSVFSQASMKNARTPETATTRSSRRKPPPKGEVTAAAEGQKSVTHVKRSAGSKNKRRRVEEETEQADDIDPNEEKYCICDDISYGEMILCDNHCEREWFHLECMHMTKADIPSRRAKWYCPECRQVLGVDAYGNPLVPPALPGRRGNRSA
ncbi:hypothetical protein ACN47E_007190 [Coniothyrium glycines]